MADFLNLNKQNMKMKWGKKQLSNTTKKKFLSSKKFSSFFIVFSLFNIFVSLSLSAQESNARLSGIVKDETDETLTGVTVAIKGTGKGTITDVNGKFSITNAPSKGVLTFTFVGLETQEIPYDGSQTFNNIVLKVGSINFNDVVVVGYGTVKKKDLTGSVTSIGNKEITAIGTNSPMAALQSQVAGVNISANTGQVGSDFTVEIRGVNSLTGGKPLYVVDGVMTDNINFLNPSDIERIDILKDASSTAIYGSRGSNGVVLVTTNTGKGANGGTSFSYSGSAGYRTIANMPDFLNYDQGVEYNMNRDITKKQYQGKALVAADGLFGFPETGDAHTYWVNALANRRGTNWIDLMLKPGLEQNHFISGSGGNEKVSFLVGAGYQGDNGNIEGQYYNKYNFKTSVDAKLSEKWSMGTNINFAYTDKELRSQSAEKTLFRMAPWIPAYDEQGEMLQTPMNGISGNVSPLADMKNNLYSTQNFYLISNFYVGFKPTSWLSLKSTFSPNFQLERIGIYKDALSTKSVSQGQMSMERNLSYIWDNQLSANKKIDDHSFNFDFIYSLQSDEMEYLYGYGKTLPFNSGYWNVGSGSTLNTSSNYEKSTLMSYTGRINYNYLGKYLFTASTRWDGSSKLAEGHKWAFFPSAAIAWRASDEDFIQQLDLFSNLKVRLSYGYTGNNNIDSYLTQFAANSQTYYDWNGTTANGFRPSAIANKNLTWERTREWNLGIDYGFLDSRISGEINVYDKLSLSLLMERKLAVPTGWESMMDNVGSVSNKGIEFQLRTINIKTKDFEWETNFNFSANRNAIVELYGKKEDDVANRWFIGQPVNVVYAMVYDGVWQRDELEESQLQTMEGTAKVKDLNGDGVIDIDHDMKILGSPAPEWIGSFNTKFRYKNWDLMASFYTKQGVFLYSPFHREFTDFNSKQILDVPYYVRDNGGITKTRYSKTYPQASYMGTYWGEGASEYGYPGFNKDASFVRMQNISLGYSFGEKALKKLGMSAARFYVNVINPFVWTDYEGFDPEWAGATVDGDNANTNSYRIFQLGTNITF